MQDKKEFLVNTTKIQNIDLKTAMPKQEEEEEKLAHAFKKFALVMSKEVETL